MKPTCLLIVLALTLLAPPASAQPSPASQDEADIRKVVQALADAWTAGDGKAFAAPFAEDADFTVWTGLYVKGRPAIAQGHEQIFSTVYKGTKLKLEPRSIRFLRPDVAVVHADGAVVPTAQEFPAKPDVVPVLILTKDQGRWQVSVFQNTKVQAPGGPPPQ